MKKTILLTAVISAFAMASAYATTPATSAAKPSEQSCHHHRCNDVQLNTLNMNGHSDIRHSTIKEQAIVRGHAVIDDSSFGALNVYGHTEMEKVQVAGATMLHGHADVEDSQLHQLTVYGHIVAEDSEFAGPMVVYGDVHLEDSNLAMPLTVHGQKIVLEDSKVQNITVQAGNNQAPVCVFLKGKTAVSGDITVTNATQAYVVKYRRATVGGKVTGATTVNKAPKDC